MAARTLDEVTSWVMDGFRVSGSSFVATVRVPPLYGVPTAFVVLELDELPAALDELDELLALLPQALSSATNMRPTTSQVAARIPFTLSS
jgi:hypothetical protein